MLKLLTSKLVKLLQPENMLLIYVTLLVSSILKLFIAVQFLYSPNNLYGFAGACIVVSSAPMYKSYFVLSVVFGITQAITSPAPSVNDASQLASASFGTFTLSTNVIELIKSAVYFLLFDLFAPIA